MPHTFVLIQLQAIKDSSIKLNDAGTVGYGVGYHLVRDNLLINNIVVTDSVNSIEVTRKSWRRCAKEINKNFIEIEVICSNIIEHQNRVKTRSSTIRNHILPTWDNVLMREYEKWLGSHIIIDTSNKTAGESVNELLLQIEEFKKNNFI